MFLETMLGTGAGPHNPSRVKIRRRLPGLPVILAAGLWLGGCGSGQGDASGPEVTGGALGVEGAHEHGAARVGLAVDGVSLTLDLQAPGDAIFGFEHAPSTDEERAVVSEALARVRSQAGSLLSLEGELGCAVDGVEILEAPDLDRAPAADAHDGEESPHSEMRARITWSCSASPEGTPAALRLGTLLPGLEFVDLTVITSRGQAAGRVGGDAAFRF